MAGNLPGGSKPGRAVTGFDVTYGEGLAPQGYHRVVTGNGEPANLNRATSSSDGPATYLWYTRKVRPSVDQVVVDMALVSENEDLQPGYMKVAKNLRRGISSPAIFLGYLLRGEAEADSSDTSGRVIVSSAPICDVRALSPGEETPEGYIAVTSPRGMEEDGSFRLCFARLGSEVRQRPQNWTLDQVIEGDWLEVWSCPAEDSVGSWLVAQVCAKGDEGIRLTFCKTQPQPNGSSVSLTDADMEAVLPYDVENFAPLGTFIVGEDAVYFVKMELARRKNLPLQARELKMAEGRVRSQLRREMWRDSGENTTTPEGGPSEYVESPLGQSKVGVLDAGIPDSVAEVVGRCLHTTIQQRGAGRVEVTPQRIQLFLCTVLKCTMRQLSKLTSSMDGNSLGSSPEYLSRLKRLQLLLDGDEDLKWAKFGVYSSSGDFSSSYDHIFAKASPSSGLSPVLAESINVFFNEGGRDLMLQRLSRIEALGEVMDKDMQSENYDGRGGSLMMDRALAARGRLEEVELQVWLSIAVAMEPLLLPTARQSLVKDFLPLFRDAILARRDEDLLQTPQFDYVYYYGKFIAHVGDPEHGRCKDLFELSLAVRYLCCPYLPLRLQGIKTLKMLSDGSLSGSTFPANLSYGRMASLRVLNKVDLAEFIAEQCVVEILVGDKSARKRWGVPFPHVELLKHCASLLCLLIETKRFTQRHMLLLWEAAAGPEREDRGTATSRSAKRSHLASADLGSPLSGGPLTPSSPPPVSSIAASEARVVFDLLTGLASALDLSHLRDLCGLLAGSVKQRQQVFDQELAFAHSLGIVVLARPDCPEDVLRQLLDLLWLACTGDICVQHGASSLTQAEEELVRLLLANPNRCQPLADYAELCVRNVRKQQSVSESLRVLQMVAVQAPAAASIRGVALRSGERVGSGFVERRTDTPETAVSGGAGAGTSSSGSGGGGGGSALMAQVTKSFRKGVAAMGAGMGVHPAPSAVLHLLDELEELHGLLDLVLNNTCEYLQRVSAAVLAQQGSGGAKSQGTRPSGGRSPSPESEAALSLTKREVKEALDIRFSFLSFLLSRSSALLSFSHVRRLWAAAGLDQAAQRSRIGRSANGSVSGLTRERVGRGSPPTWDFLLTECLLAFLASLVHPDGTADGDSGAKVGSASTAPFGSFPSSSSSSFSSSSSSSVSSLSSSSTSSSFVSQSRSIVDSVASASARLTGGGQSSAAGVSAVGSLAPSAAGEIFEGLLCDEDKLNYADLGPQGFRCFQAYFHAVNSSGGGGGPGGASGSYSVGRSTSVAGSVTGSASTSVSGSTSASALHGAQQLAGHAGFDSLWRIALHVVRESVAVSSFSLLVSLYVHPPSGTAAGREREHAAMGLLRTCVAASTDVAGLLGIADAAETDLAGDGSGSDGAQRGSDGDRKGLEAPVPRRAPSSPVPVGESLGSAAKERELRRLLQLTLHVTRVFCSSDDGTDKHDGADPARGESGSHRETAAKHRLFGEADWPRRTDSFSSTSSASTSSPSSSSSAAATATSSASFPSSSSLFRPSAPSVAPHAPLSGPAAAAANGPGLGLSLSGSSHRISSDKKHSFLPFRKSGASSSTSAQSSSSASQAGAGAGSGHRPSSAPSSRSREEHSNLGEDRQRIARKRIEDAYHPGMNPVQLYLAEADTFFDILLAIVNQDPHDRLGWVGDGAVTIRGACSSTGVRVQKGEASAEDSTIPVNRNGPSRSLCSCSSSCSSSCSPCCCSQSASGGAGGQLRAVAWALLQSMPVNLRMLMRLASFDLNHLTEAHRLSSASGQAAPDLSLAGTDWDLIVRRGSSLLLLYQLRLLAILARSRDWTGQFILYGGLNHLLQLFLQLSTSELTSRGEQRQCLAALLALFATVLSFGLSGHLTLASCSPLSGRAAHAASSSSSSASSSSSSASSPSSSASAPSSSSSSISSPQLSPPDNGVIAEGSTPQEPQDSFSASRGLPDASLSEQVARKTLEVIGCLCTTSAGANAKQAQQEMHERGVGRALRAQHLRPWEREKTSGEAVDNFDHGSYRSPWIQTACDAIMVQTEGGDELLQCVRLLMLLVRVHPARLVSVMREQLAEVREALHALLLHEQLEHLRALAQREVQAVCGWRSREARSSSLADAQDAGEGRQELQDARWDLRALFLRLLVELAPRTYAFEDRCGHFFDLVLRLIRLVAEPSMCEVSRRAPSSLSPASSSPERWTCVSVLEEAEEHLVSVLLSHPALEVSKSDADVILRGLLRALTALQLAVAHLADLLRGQQPHGESKVPLAPAGALSARRAQRLRKLVEDVVERGLFALPHPASPNGTAYPSKDAPDGREPRAELAARHERGFEPAAIPLPTCKSPWSRRLAMDLLLAVVQGGGAEGASLVVRQLLRHYGLRNVALWRKEEREAEGGGSELTLKEGRWMRRKKKRLSGWYRDDGPDGSAGGGPGALAYPPSSSSSSSSARSAGLSLRGPAPGAACGPMSASSSSAGSSAWSLSGSEVVGYTGLHNLGNTCYMNSTLQQFFMIPAFRRRLLQLRLPLRGSFSVPHAVDEAAETLSSARAGAVGNVGEGAGGGGAEVGGVDPRSDSEDAAEELESARLFGPNPSSSSSSGSAYPSSSASSASALLPSTVAATASDAEGAGGDFLFELQYLFAHLQESELPWFDPLPFTQAMKDWDGNPIDVLMQQDASEFLTQFLQQVETNLMGSREESLLQDVFGGVFSNELIAPGRYSEREEPFYFISVQVKDHQTLEQSLRSWAKGEMVEYTWTDAGGEEKNVKKTAVATEKRTSIKVLPQHLVVHLKRFEFDLNLMQQVKVNDRFAFPRLLDMWPYTKEGRARGHDQGNVNGITEERGGGEQVTEPEETTAGAVTGAAEATTEPSATDPGTEREEEASAAGTREPQGAIATEREDYLYELMGVVVHSGTAHSGHYYSYIREREEEPETTNAKPGEAAGRVPSGVDFNARSLLQQLGDRWKVGVCAGERSTGCGQGPSEDEFAPEAKRRLHAEAHTCHGQEGRTQIRASEQESSNVVGTRIDGWLLTSDVNDDKSALGGARRSVPEHSAGSGQWLEFNDTIVRPFDAERLPLECFGGTEEEEELARASGMGTKASEGQRELKARTALDQSGHSSLRINNAFMLIYDKVRPRGCGGKGMVAETPTSEATTGPTATRTGGQGGPVVDIQHRPRPDEAFPPTKRMEGGDDVEQCSADASEGSASAAQTLQQLRDAECGRQEAIARHAYLARRVRHRAPVPAHVRREVWRENVEFWRGEVLFNQQHINFLYALFELVLRDALRTGGSAPAGGDRVGAGDSSAAESERTEVEAAEADGRNRAEKEAATDAEAEAEARLGAAIVGPPTRGQLLGELSVLCLGALLTVLRWRVSQSDELMTRGNTRSWCQGVWWDYRRFRQLLHHTLRAHPLAGRSLLSALSSVSSLELREILTPPVWWLRAWGGHSALSTSDPLDLEEGDADLDPDQAAREERVRRREAQLKREDAARRRDGHVGEEEGVEDALREQQEASERLLEEMSASLTLQEGPTRLWLPSWNYLGAEEAQLAAEPGAGGVGGENMSHKTQRGQRAGAGVPQYEDYYCPGRLLPSLQSLTDFRYGGTCGAWRGALLSRGEKGELERAESRDLGPLLLRLAEEDKQRPLLPMAVNSALRGLWVRCIGDGLEEQLHKQGGGVSTACGRHGARTTSSCPEEGAADLAWRLLLSLLQLLPQILQGGALKQPQYFQLLGDILRFYPAFKRRLLETTELCQSAVMPLLVCFVACQPAIIVGSDAQGQGTQVRRGQVEAEALVSTVASSTSYLCSSAAAVASASSRSSTKGADAARSPSSPSSCHPTSSLSPSCAEILRLASCTSSESSAAGQDRVALLGADAETCNMVPAPPPGLSHPCAGLLQVVSLLGCSAMEVFEQHEAKDERGMARASDGRASSERVTERSLRHDEGEDGQDQESDEARAVVQSTVELLRSEPFLRACVRWLTGGLALWVLRRLLIRACGPYLQLWAVVEREAERGLASATLRNYSLGAAHLRRYTRALRVSSEAWSLFHAAEETRRKAGEPARTAPAPPHGRGEAPAKGKEAQARPLESAHRGALDAVDHAEAAKESRQQHHHHHHHQTQQQLQDVARNVDDQDQARGPAATDLLAACDEAVGRVCSAFLRGLSELIRANRVSCAVVVAQMLLRAAKGSLLLRLWLRDKADTWRWLEQWLDKQYDASPGHYPAAGRGAGPLLQLGPGSRWQFKDRSVDFSRLDLCCSQEFTRVLGRIRHILQWEAADYPDDPVFLGFEEIAVDALEGRDRRSGGEREGEGAGEPRSIRHRGRDRVVAAVWLPDGRAVASQLIGVNGHKDLASQSDADVSSFWLKREIQTGTSVRSGPDPRQKKKQSQEREPEPPAELEFVFVAPPPRRSVFITSELSHYLGSHSAASEVSQGGLGGGVHGRGSTANAFSASSALSSASAASAASLALSEEQSSNPQGRNVSSLPRYLLELDRDDPPSSLLGARLSFQWKTGTSHATFAGVVDRYHSSVRVPTALDRDRAQAVLEWEMQRDVYHVSYEDGALKYYDIVDKSYEVCMRQPPERAAWANTYVRGAPQR